MKFGQRQRASRVENGIRVGGLLPRAKILKAGPDERKGWRAGCLAGRALRWCRGFTPMNPERTSLGRSIAAHAVTVLMTLALAGAPVGVRWGCGGNPRRSRFRDRRGCAPELARPGSGRARAGPSRRSRRPRPADPPPARRRAQGPRPRGAEQRPGLRQGQPERRQHHDRVRGERVLRRRDVERDRARGSSSTSRGTS